MTWKEKIAEGMELIASGCDDNKKLLDCKECPFTMYCDLIKTACDNDPDMNIPETWWH